MPRVRRPQNRPCPAGLRAVGAWLAWLAPPVAGSDGWLVLPALSVPTAVPITSCAAPRIEAGADAAEVWLEAAVLTP